LRWSDRLLLLESLGTLAAARLVIKLSPKKNLVSRVGGARVEPADLAMTGGTWAGAAPPGRGQAERIGAMLERAARVTLWRSMCLEKALAGKWMLRRRGIASTMYVGMARRGPEFVAHAWLVGDGHILTGGGNTPYATLAAFHEPGR
jgi:hypothetical protein